MISEPEKKITSNQFGFGVEDLFAQECEKRGIVLTKPAKPEAWDFTTNLGDRSLKIQVKGTSTLVRNKDGFAYRFRCYRNTNPPRSYRDSGVDVIAGYVVPLARWHIFEAPPGLNKIHVTRNPTGKQRLAIGRWELVGGKNDQ